jgi:hypothetical protein
MSAGAGPHNPQPDIPDRGAAAAEWPLCVPQSDGCTVLVRAGCVKARIVRLGFRAAAAVRAHLSYLRREGVTKDGASARMFDAVSDDADLRAFAERAADDGHHFRFIVSPEDATEMADLRAFTAISSGRWSTTSERGWIGSGLITGTPTIPTSI